MRDWKQEIRKQAIDQPLHMLWGGVSVWLCVEGVTRFPHVMAFVGALAGLLSVLWIVLREVDQWPSSRWWDPPLDWLCFVLGGVGGGILAWQVWPA